MITYKICYSSTSSNAQERFAKAETNFLGYIADNIAKPKPYIAFEKIIKEVVEAVNNLLETPNQTNKISFDSLAILLSKIIPQLEKLETHDPNKNRTVITELKNIHANDINPTTIISRLVEFKVEGIEKVEFTTGINQEILANTHFPLDSVPEIYNCNVQMTIMSEPIVATTTARIDRVVTAGATNNPYTRAPWLEIEIDVDLSKKITDFIRKIEWLYYAFQDNEQYKNLYLNPRIKNLLQDDKLSYMDFKSQVNQHIGAQNTQAVTIKTVVYPCKYILDLFYKYELDLFFEKDLKLPSKQNYELLIHRLVAYGNIKGLELLLNSPILEFVTINVNAINYKKQNVFDIINSDDYKYPQLKAAFYELLTRNQETPANYTSNSSWIGEQAYSYLPSFNRYTVLAALSTLATVGAAGAAMYFGSNNSDALSATPNP